jgi:hypothetical protein
MSLPFIAFRGILSNKAMRRHIPNPIPPMYRTPMIKKVQKMAAKLSPIKTDEDARTRSYSYSFSNLGSELNSQGNGVGLPRGYIFNTFSLSSISLAVKGFVSFWLMTTLKVESNA